MHKKAPVANRFNLLQLPDGDTGSSASSSDDDANSTHSNYNNHIKTNANSNTKRANINKNQNLEGKPNLNKNEKIDDKDLLDDGFKMPKRREQKTKLKTKNTSWGLMNCWGSLEEPLLRAVFLKLDGRDVAQSSATCHQFYLASCNLSVWRNALRVRYPLLFEQLVGQAEIFNDWRKIRIVYKNQSVREIEAKKEDERWIHTTRSPKQVNYRRWAKMQMEDQGLDFGDPLF